jgi:hypothetical protein
LGKQIPFFFDADAVVNLTIPPYETPICTVCSHTIYVHVELYDLDGECKVVYASYASVFPTKNGSGHADLISFLPLSFLWKK